MSNIDLVKIKRISSIVEVIVGNDVSSSSASERGAYLDALNSQLNQEINQIYREILSMGDQLRKDVKIELKKLDKNNPSIVTMIELLNSNISTPSELINNDKALCVVPIDYALNLTDDFIETYKKKFSLPVYVVVDKRYLDIGKLIRDRLLHKVVSCCGELSKLSKIVPFICRLSEEDFEQALKEYGYITAQLKKNNDIEKVIYFTNDGKVTVSKKCIVANI